MKKLLVALIGVAALCGCDELPKEGDGSLKPNGNTFYTGNGSVSKVKIEGHDYLLYRYYEGGGICHSASCPCHTNNLNRINN